MAIGQRELYAALGMMGGDHLVNLVNIVSVVTFVVTLKVYQTIIITIIVNERQLLFTAAKLC